MLLNYRKYLSKTCPILKRGVVVFPLALLGIIGLLINTHISFITENFGLCSPKKNIVFLKTHKCASSSIQNILMRYGDAQNLTFVLPKQANYIGHPTPFNRSLLPTPHPPVFNILSHHTRLNYAEIKALMPENTIYITIVRDPVQLFESSYSYYELNKFFRSGLHKFISLIPRLNKTFINRRLRGRHGINQMIFDLGADPAIFENETLVGDYINRLESWFHLVLVAERMEESLILLRHLMCWELDTVITFKLNSRDPKFKSSLNTSEKLTLEELNKADVMLYKHFLAKFEKQVEAFGYERMSVEIKELAEKTKSWYNLCVKGKHISEVKKSKFYTNPKILVLEPETNITNAPCSRWTMEELVYTDLLRKKQLRRFPEKLKSVIHKKKAKKHKRKLRNLSKTS